MIVTIGVIDATSPPAAARRSSPRSTASAAASAWGTVKLTVALMLTPRKVASSMATIPAAVAGNLTWMFGASAANRTACSTIRAGSRWLAGFVWTESRPCRPPARSKTGWRMPAPRAAISSMIAQVSSTSVQVGFAAASSWTRGTQCAFSFFMTSSTMLGLEVAPVAPRSTA